MVLLKGLAIGLLGSAALLPLPPAWADEGPASATAASASQEATGASGAGCVDGGRAGREAWRKERQGDREAFAQARLAALQAGLQLTGEQQTLWTPVASAIRTVQGLGDHGDHGRASSGQGEGTDGEGPGDLSLLKEHSARMVATGKAMEELADAVGPFVASLTPDQKHRLPVLLDGMRPRRILREAFGLRNDDGWMGRRHADGADDEGSWRGGHDGDAGRGGNWTDWAPPWVRGMRDEGPRGDD